MLSTVSPNRTAAMLLIKPHKIAWILRILGFVQESLHTRLVWVPIPGAVAAAPGIFFLGSGGMRMIHRLSQGPKWTSGARHAGRAGGSPRL